MIKKIKIGLNNLYLFENEKCEYLLFDTGITVKKEKILKKLMKEIGDLKKIKIIVVSHSHADHVGNLKLLADEIKNIQILAHKNSGKILFSGKSVIPKGFYPFTKKISKNLQNKKNHTKNIFPKLEKSDTQKTVFIDFFKKEKFLLSEYGFKNITIIETKGHSNDSISLEVLGKRKYLFCGDLIQNLCFKFPLISLFGEDKDELLKSWKKIIENDYEKIFPATGKAVTTQDLIRRMKNEKN